jgi:hypothetical protein
MKELPEDLAAMGTDELAQQCEVRDSHIAPLFRRWPALRRRELRDLRRVYGERLRIARHLGKTRARVRRAP